MVMNYPHEINNAYLDYQMGKMGLPWDHELSDEEWLKHVEKYPSQYGSRGSDSKRTAGRAAMLRPPSSSTNPDETVDYKYYDEYFG